MSVSPRKAEFRLHGLFVRASYDTCSLDETDETQNGVLSMITYITLRNTPGYLINELQRELKKAQPRLVQCNAAYKVTKNRFDKTGLPGNGACVALVSFELTSGTARLFLGCREAGSSYN